MTMVLAVCVAVTFGVSVYLLLSRELKAVAMGVFLLSHAANLSILTMSGSPILGDPGPGQAVVKRPPVSDHEFDKLLRQDQELDALSLMVDPLPQALILTAIVIGFAVMGFLLSLLVVTSRKVGTLEVRELASVGAGPLSLDANAKRPETAADATNGGDA